MSRALRPSAATAVVAGALLVCVGCAPASVDPLERLGRRAVEKVEPGAAAPAARRVDALPGPPRAGDGRVRPQGLDAPGPAEPATRLLSRIHRVHRAHGTHRAHRPHRADAAAPGRTPEARPGRAREAAPGRP
ncbi:hypothetical protein ACFWU3_00740 [Streptomyces sp. NPDC058685]|uniref:hypothetical protein n=1 Tax=Streptomyces sp. NPDC058685 TaxID=3346598 RepID=UPI0036552008